MQAILYVCMAITLFLYANLKDNIESYLYSQSHKHHIHYISTCHISYKL